LSRGSKLEDYNIEIRRIPTATLLNQLKKDEDDKNIISLFEAYWNDQY
jgi:hypothetical protein